MAIEFTNKPIKWENEGTAPSEDLKTNGFQAGYKPPAAVFNNQWHITGECIEELQTKLSGVDDKKVDKADGKSLIDEGVADNLSCNNGDICIKAGQELKTNGTSVYGVTIHDEGIRISNGKPVYAQIRDSGIYVTQEAMSAAPPNTVSTVGLTSTSGVTVKAVSDQDVTLTKKGKTHKLSEKLDAADFNANAVTKDSSANMGINGELIFPHPLGGSTNYVKIDGDNGVVAHYENSEDISEEIRPDITLIQGSKTHKLSEKANVSDLPIKSLAGQTVNPTSDTSVIANAGATIIGDIHNRAFTSSDNIGSGNVATGYYAVAIGTCNNATGNYAIAGGTRNKASGNNAVALGENNTVTGDSAFACGYNSSSTNFCSFAMGSSVKSNGESSIAIGKNSQTDGKYSIAMGCKASANERAVALGTSLNALDFQTKIGQYAKDGTAGASESTNGDAFIIGNGTYITASNAFRVTYEGKAYGLSAYSSTGADYAELFEWKDGNPDNEDRRGRLVTLDGEKIRFATSEDDYILGVVSANPCIEGDVYSDDWQGKYLTDVFGQRLTQTVHIPARYEEQEVIDPETGETTTENVLIEDEHDAVQWVLNPDYDPEQEYVSREDRKEWSAIGLMGKLVVVDDGTCEVNGYCKAGVNGIATKADDGYRVMARIDDTHIRVLVR